MIIMVFLAIAASFALFLGLLLVVIGILFAVIYVMTIYLFILPVLMVEGPKYCQHYHQDHNSGTQEFLVEYRMDSGFCCNFACSYNNFFRIDSPAFHRKVFSGLYQSGRSIYAD